MFGLKDFKGPEWKEALMKKNPIIDESTLPKVGSMLQNKDFPNYKYTVMKTYENGWAIEVLSCTDGKTHSLKYEHLMHYDHLSIKKDTVDEST